MVERTLLAPYANQVQKERAGVQKGVITDRGGKGAETVCVKTAACGRVQGGMQKQTAGEGLQVSARVVLARQGSAWCGSAYASMGSPLRLYMCTVRFTGLGVLLLAREDGQDAPINFGPEQAGGATGDDTGGPGHRGASTLHR